MSQKTTNSIKARAAKEEGFSMNRLTRVPKRLPKPTSIDPMIRSYHRNLAKYANLYIRLARAGLTRIIPGLREESSDEQPNATRVDSAYTESRMDANIEKKVRDILDHVNAELEKAFPDALLQQWARAMAGQATNISKKNIKRVTAKVGVDVEPMMHDRGLAPWLQNVVDENVGLIKSIPLKKLESFKNGLVALITGDAPQDEIRKLITKHFSGIGVNAKLIARDQVGKLNGRINQYRQQSLGASRYIWRGSKDERERPDHRRLEGKIFSWDKPPITNRRTGARNNPGEDYQCRCHAEMYLPDLLE